MRNEVVPNADNMPVPKADNMPVPKADNIPAPTYQADMPEAATPKISVTFRRGAVRVHHTASATPAVTHLTVQTHRFFVYGLVALTLIFWASMGSVIGILIAISFACCLFVWAGIYSDHRKADDGR
jgi:hypothetical protein